jgi:putative hydrolases of HD superfamily
MLAVVHDLAEAQVGDITPDEAFTKEEKRKLEEVSNIYAI